MNHSSDISGWMEKFKDTWLAKDIDAVMDLFTDDVAYWETPFELVSKDGSLQKAWEEILPLQDMRLDYEIFSSDEKRNRYAVRWHFTHAEAESAGVYLIELNEHGLCTYFYHSAQPNI